VVSTERTTGILSLKKFRNVWMGGKKIALFKNGEGGWKGKRGVHPH